MPGLEQPAQDVPLAHRYRIQRYGDPTGFAPGRGGALSRTTKNRKVEVRKLLIFRNPIFGFSL
jgi:hypothetical protein